MNRSIDRILVGTLWLCAIVLAACVWFSMRFGFDLFSGAHWGYLATVQLGPVDVAPAFYISVITFMAICLFGFYIIFRPRLRKIQLANVPTPPVPVAITPTPISRPPSIGPKISGTNNYQTQTAVKVSTPSAAKISRFNNADLDRQISDIVASAGYLIKKPVRISGIAPSVFAIGMDESLILGIGVKTSGNVKASDDKWSDDNGEFKSPVAMVADMAQRLQSLFTETLDEDLKINIMPFVLIDGGEISNMKEVLSIWESLGVGLFTGIESFDNYIKDHQNRTVNDNEKEDFDAYSEYMDVVANYFNSEVKVPA